MSVPSVGDESKSGSGSEFSQTPTSFETGGRNALNLQMAALDEIASRTHQLLHSNSDYRWGQVKQIILAALQSAQAASDGKEQGTPRQSRESAWTAPEHATPSTFTIPESSPSSATVRGQVEGASIYDFLDWLNRKPGSSWTATRTDVLDYISSLPSDIEEQPAQEVPRIYSRCWACKNDTLTINDGHLLCTWIDCPNPTLMDSPPLPDNGEAVQKAAREVLTWFDSGAFFGCEANDAFSRLRVALSSLKDTGESKP